jgi:ParB family chromosome partitioning protein
MPERPATPERRASHPLLQAGQLTAEGLRAQSVRLQEAIHQGRLIESLDPKAIRATRFSNRHELSLLADDPKFVELRESIRAHGQDEPIRVRPLQGAAPFQFEIVAGHRRHAACLALDAEGAGGFPVLARVDRAAAQTRDLVLKMFRENEHRADLSPFEKGRMFQTWLDEGVFPTQGEIAAAVGLTDSSLGRYRTIGNLPDDVLAAFGDPREISARFAEPLAKALKANREAVVAEAAKLAKMRPLPGHERVLARLTAAAGDTDRHGKPAAARPAPINLDGPLPVRLSADERGRVQIDLQQPDTETREAFLEDLKVWLRDWYERRSVRP